MSFVAFLVFIKLSGKLHLKTKLSDDVSFYPKDQRSLCSTYYLLQTKGWYKHSIHSTTTWKHFVSQKFTYNFKGLLKDFFFIKCDEKWYHSSSPSSTSEWVFSKCILSKEQKIPSLSLSFLSSSHFYNCQEPRRLIADDDNVYGLNKYALAESFS